MRTLSALRRLAGMVVESGVGLGSLSAADRDAALAALDGGRGRVDAWRAVGCRRRARRRAACRARVVEAG